MRSQSNQSLHLMTKENVIKIIRFYPQIGREIRLYTDLLEQFEQEWGVCGISPSECFLQSNIKSDLTALKAEKLAKSGDGDIMRDIEAHIVFLKNLQREVLLEFNRLSSFQKQVVYYFYIDSKQWVWIARQLGYDERHCRRIRDEALKKLAFAFAQNTLIKPI